MISLDLYGIPIPYSRPRLSKGHVYDPRQKEKEGAKWQLKSQYRNELLAGPLYIDAIFFMPIPKSTSTIRKRQMVHNKIHHMSKPDIDNLLKFVLDCLNKTIIQDDRQIVKLSCEKKYSQNPGTLIRIYPLSETQRVEGEDLVS